MNRLEDSLARFVGDIEERVLLACGREEFEPSLRKVLQETARLFFGHADPSDFAQPLGLYFVSLRSFGKASDELSRVVGEFLCFYLLAADVFDDIEDGETDRKPFAQFGTAIATNAALTFLVLGLDALGRAVEGARSREQATALLRVFNRVSLTAVAAQHRDLLGGNLDRSGVLSLHEGKTSSLALLTECGAIVAEAASAETHTFRKLGFQLAQVAQIVDDVRDIFGKELSVDLLGGKPTYPLACLRELLPPQRFDEYLSLCAESHDAETLRQLRAIYYESGAIEACAEKVEELRSDIYTLVGSLGALRAEHRLLLAIVDTLAGTLYEPEPLDSLLAVASDSPRGNGSLVPGTFAEELDEAAHAFAGSASLWAGADLPRQKGWHLPFFMFSPEERCIYFPDVDGLPAEVLPFYSSLLDLPLSEVERLLRRLGPFLLAHEMVHARRFDLGLLSEDTWTEEVIADTVGLAHVAFRHPEVASAVVNFSARVLALHPPTPDLLEFGRRSLNGGLAPFAATSTRPAPDASSGVAERTWSPLEMAQLHALFLLEGPRLDLEAGVERCLSVGLGGCVAA